MNTLAKFLLRTSFLCFILFLLNISYGQNRLIWTNGGGDKDWANPLNWQEESDMSNRVPTINDIAIMDNGDTININTVEQNAKELIIESNSTLNVNVGTLRIDCQYGLNAVFFDNGGGTIRIAEGAGMEISNTQFNSIFIAVGIATIDNAGTITISRTEPVPVGSMAASGIHLNGFNFSAQGGILNLTNQTTGIIQNTDTLFSEFIFVERRLTNQASIVNYGLIDIAHTDLKDDFVFGQIEVSAFLFDSPTTFDNFGTINLDSLTLSGFELFAGSRLTNHASGVINIKDTEGEGIFMGEDATVINDGEINITQNTGGDFSGGQGIELDSDNNIFTNNGTINISGTEQEESLKLMGQFTNNCLVNIGVGAGVSIGLGADGILNNNACGIINLSSAADIIFNEGIITNNGIITSTTTQTNNNTNTFENNGIIASSGGIFNVMPTALTGTGIIQDSPIPASKIEITGRDTTICANATLNVEDLINGTPKGNLSWGFFFGAYPDTITSTAVFGNTSMIIFIRDSIETTGCVDTAKIEVTVIPVFPFSTQPQNDTTCNLGNAAFNVTSTGGGTLNGMISTLQWQESADGSNFVDIANAGIYSGVTTLDLNLTGVTVAKDDFQYRLIASNTLDAFVCRDTSNTAILQVLNIPNISQQPFNDTTCVDGMASFMLSANTTNGGTLSFQWQESIDGTNFIDLANGAVFSGVNTNTLNLTNTPLDKNNHFYRVIIQETLGTFFCTDTSNAGILQVLDVPNISLQASNDTTCVDGMAAFMVTANATDGGTLSFQWQESTDGSNFTNLSNAGIFSGVTTNTLSLTNVPLNKNNHFYRLIIREAVGTVVCETTSDIGNLQVLDVPSISIQPSNDTTCIAGMASFMVTASATDGGILSYQWQESLDGINFIDLSNNGIFSNVNTSTLNLSNVPLSKDEHFYRVIIRETVGTIICETTSDAGNLQVLNLPTIAVQPANDTICKNGMSRFMVNATTTDGGTLSYQWQESADDTNFTDLTNGGIFSGVHTNTLSLVNVPSSKDNHFYRVIVRETLGTIVCADTSNVGNLQVSNITIVSQPSNDSTCVNGTVNFMVTASASGALSYQWQESTDGTNFMDLTEGGVFSGVNTNTLSLTNVPLSKDNHSYRVIISEQVGSIICPVTSNTAVLSLEALSVGGIISVSPSICEGVKLVLLELNGHIGNIVKWQSATSIDFQNAVDIPNTTNMLEIENIEGIIYYRAIVKNGNCAEAFSNEIMLHSDIFGAEQIMECQDNIGVLGTSDGHVMTGTYHASKTLISPGTINEGYTVTFKAGESITLYPCFHAKTGSEFQAVIETCTSYPYKVTLEEKKNILTTDADKENLSFDVFPNPFEYQAQLSFYLPTNDWVAIQLADQTGSIIQSILPKQRMDIGKHSVLLNNHQLNNGMYYAILQTSKEYKVKKLIIAGR